MGDIPAMTRNLHLEGWSVVSPGSFMTMIGPIWKRGDNGRLEYGLLADNRHANHRSIVHGGVIMAFADYGVGMAAAEMRGNIHQVTIQLDVHFVSAAEIGDLLIASGEVVRQTALLSFVQGRIETNGRVVATATGVWKSVKPRLKS